MNNCSVSLAAAVVAATLLVPPALAQGVLKPVDAMIVNPPTRPVPVTVLSAPTVPGEGARTPFKLNAPISFNGAAGNCSNQIFTPPAGKRLVLTYLSGIGTMPAPATVAYVAAVIGGSQLDVLAPAAAAAPYTSGGEARNMSVAGQQVHAYVDGELRLCAGAPMGGQGDVLVTAIGYLIDRP